MCVHLRSTTWQNNGVCFPAGFSATRYFHSFYFLLTGCSSCSDFSSLPTCLPATSLYPERHTSNGPHIKGFAERK